MRHLFTGFLVALLAGCSASKQLTDGHLAYNEAVRQSADQELLLNIVRLRYLEPMEFLSIAAINSTVEFTVAMQVGAGRSAGENAVNTMATAGYSVNPTFSFVPQRGSDFSDRLIQPLDIPTLVSITASHRDAHLVFRLFVTWMNGLDNQEGKVDPEFIQATRALTELQFEGIALFGFREQKRVVAPPVAAADLDPALIVEAHKAGLEIRQGPGDNGLEFTEPYQQAMLSIDGESPLRSSLAETLMLSPGADHFPIVAKLEFKEDLDGRELSVRTRSLLQTLSFLSQGIEVPPDDGTTIPGSQSPHASVDPRFMDGFFRVWFSQQEPEHASLAVPYGEGWFYIRDSDAASKRTFLLVSEAFRFTLEGNADQAPTLAFPVGGD